MAVCPTFEFRAVGKAPFRQDFEVENPTALQLACHAATKKSKLSAYGCQLNRSMQHGRQISLPGFRIPESCVKHVRIAKKRKMGEMTSPSGVEKQGLEATVLNLPNLFDGLLLNGPDKPQFVDDRTRLCLQAPKNEGLSLVRENVHALTCNFVLEKQLPLSKLGKPPLN